MHKKPLQRVIQRFSNEIVCPQPGHYMSEGHRRAVATHAAWQMAAAAIHAEAYKNPLSVAHDMGEFAKSAPRNMPALLDRLEFERIALDVLHAARRQGGAA